MYETKKVYEHYFELLKNTFIDILIRDSINLKKYEKQKLKDNLTLSNNNLYYFISCVLKLKEITTLHLTKGGKRKSNKRRKSNQRKSNKIKSNKRKSNKIKSNKRKSNKLFI